MTRVDNARIEPYIQLGRIYDEKNKDLFDSNQYAFFNKDNMSVDYRILTTLNEQIVNTSVAWNKH